MDHSESHIPYPFEFSARLSSVAHQIYQMMKSLDPLSGASTSLHRSFLNDTLRGVSELLSDVERGERAPALDDERVADELKQSLISLQGALRALQDPIQTAQTAAHQALKDGYERYRQVIARLLGEKGAPPPARLTNLKRSLFHMFWGLFAVYLAERFFVMRELWWIAASFAISAWGLELGRRLPTGWGGCTARLIYQRLFGSIMHAQEKQSVSSGTWYATAVLCVASLFSETVLILAVLTLAVGDPIAGLIGRRFGRHQLTHNRTFEGSFAFLLSASLSAYTLLVYAHPEIASPLTLALSVALGGTLGELLSAHRLDDNLTVPLGAALGGSFALSYLIV